MYTEVIWSLSRNTRLRVARRFELRRSSVGGAHRSGCRVRGSQGVLPCTIVLTDDAVVSGAAGHHGKQPGESQQRLHPSLVLKQARDHPLMVRFLLALAFLAGGNIQKAFALEARTRDLRLSDSEPLLVTNFPESPALAETAAVQPEDAISSSGSAAEREKRTDLLLRIARQHPHLARFWEAAAGLLLGAKEEQVMRLREQREKETIMREGRSAVPTPAFAIKDTTKTPFLSSRAGLMRRVARQNPNIASFWEGVGALLTGKLRNVKKMQKERRKPE